jgi:hypothetical protein
MAQPEDSLVRNEMKPAARETPLGPDRSPVNVTIEPMTEGDIGEVLALWLASAGRLVRDVTANRAGRLTGRAQQSAT